MGAVTIRKIAAALAHAQVVFWFICGEFERFVGCALVRAVAEGLVL
jgi:hypothetical protein